MNIMKKTEIQLKEDAKDMWIHYFKYRRNKRRVLEVFQKFLLPEPVDGIIEQGTIFKLFLTYDEDLVGTVYDTDEEYTDALNKMADNIINYLEANDFQPAYNNDNKWEIYINIENFIEAILKL